MVAQNGLPAKWEEETHSTGLTARAGLPLCLELMAVLALPEMITEEIGLRPDQGWADIQHIASLTMLKLAGGDCVTDLKYLEADEGWCELLECFETHRLQGDTQEEIESRMRRGGERTHPSETAVRDYLEDVEPDDVTLKAEGGQGAEIPEPSEALEGLRKVAAVPVQVAGPEESLETATLDIDATIIESQNRSARKTYQGETGYQPMTVFWYERRQIPFSEFRDGNCPAAWRVEAVLEEAIDHLPDEVEEIRMRSDTAGYETDLLKHMAEGELGPCGVIRFAVGVDITDAFKQSCLEVDKDDWIAEQLPVDEDDPDSERTYQTGREYAQVPFVPDWLGYTKRDLGLRFIAIREPLDSPSGLEGQEDDDPDEPSCPAMQFETEGYKITGLVTNRDGALSEIVDWYYERCGYSEQVHSECKEDLGGAPLPSADHFQANAAWWQNTILAYNLKQLLQRVCVPSNSEPLRRLKALRFRMLNVPGRIVRHARRYTIRVPEDHPSLPLIKEARERIGYFQRGPPTPWLKPAG